MTSLNEGSDVCRSFPIRRAHSSSHDMLGGCCPKDESGDPICSKPPLDNTTFQAYPRAAFPGPTAFIFGTAATRTSSIVSPTSTTVPPSATPSPSHEGLSSGAKAGIAVGAAVVGLAVIALGVLYVIRRRRKATTASPGDASDERAEMNDLAAVAEPKIDSGPSIPPEHRPSTPTQSERCESMPSELQGSMADDTRHQHTEYYAPTTQLHM